MASTRDRGDLRGWDTATAGYEVPRDGKLLTECNFCESQYSNLRVRACVRRQHNVHWPKLNARYATHRDEPSPAGTKELSPAFQSQCENSSFENVAENCTLHCCRSSLGAAAKFCCPAGQILYRIDRGHPLHFGSGFAVEVQGCSHSRCRSFPGGNGKIWGRDFPIPAGRSRSSGSRLRR